MLIRSANTDFNCRELKSFLNFLIEQTQRMFDSNHPLTIRSCYNQWKTSLKVSNKGKGWCWCFKEEFYERILRGSLSITRTTCILWAYLATTPRRGNKIMTMETDDRPNRLTKCCPQFKSPGVKILCVLQLYYNVAFTFKWYGNSWKKTFYSQRVCIGYNIELTDLVYCTRLLLI